MDDALVRTRRRGEALETSLLDAAWDELQETGYQRLTMEGVAARAGTGKQVLYRRWPNRAQLVVAAIRHRLGPLLGELLPDTGSLRGDVMAMLHRMVGRLDTVGLPTMRGMLQEFSDLGEGFFEPSRAAMRAILERAADRGEIGRRELPDRVVSLAFDLMRYEGLRTRELSASEGVEAATAVAAEIVDDVYLPLVRALAGPGRLPRVRPPEAHAR